MLITDEHIETYAMIDHGNGLTTLYGHCSQLLARVGQITPERDQELVAKLVDFLSSRYDAGNLYDILRHGLGMDHGDMEALGFQLRDYYEEVE